MTLVHFSKNATNETEKSFKVLFNNNSFDLILIKPDILHHQKIGLQITCNPIFGQTDYYYTILYLI